ncbi:hypothetical protein OIDMADRAFT_184715 [Oidiodendron maius Zn]|uniref:Zn(2)-C6 fungal-type domain-containing protein n=1 Tax=Oidiodendron maius (strain Zn) TaxID=913774 RepID=A0A0C3CV16_OIDMZ|nr:hypothetical protein OIDMADRAFT_184715 [Oidiodendron maius Zn]
MVGALRSNRCETCRKRKIKCDEVWPVCTPCKRGNRDCPPRPSLKVIDSSAQLRQQLGKQVRRKKPRRSCKDEDVKKSEEAPSRNKFAISHCKVGRGAFDLLLQATMNLTPSNQLCCAFLDCLHTQPPAYNLEIIGSFAWQIPQRFGLSDALDDVAACMMASHMAIVRGASQFSRINPKLYTRALRSVYSALEDPNECRSSNTLCAILLLQRIEALFGESFGRSELIHASGLATLLEKRGPPNLNDKFECLLTADSHMCIIHQSLVLRKTCFIASKEWAASMDVLDGQTHLQILFHRLLRQMTLWPALVREKQYYFESDQYVDPFALIQKTEQVKAAVDEIGRDLDALIESDMLIRHIPATCLSDLVSEMFEFKDRMAAVLLCYHAMYSITVYQILVSLSADPFHEPELKHEILRLSRRIWMLVEHGLKNKPLGLPMLPAALLTTADSADWEAQDQIIEIMNEFDSCQRLKCDTWTRQKLMWRAMFYRGDGSV